MTAFCHLKFVILPSSTRRNKQAAVDRSERRVSRISFELELRAIKRRVSICLLQTLKAIVEGILHRRKQRQKANYSAAMLMAAFANGASNLIVAEAADPHR